MKKKLFFMMLLLLIVPSFASSLTTKTTMTGSVHVSKGTKYTDLRYFYKKTVNGQEYWEAYPYTSNIYEFYPSTNHNRSEEKYLAYCVKPGYSANINSNDGWNDVECSPLDYNDEDSHLIAAVASQNNVDNGLNGLPSEKLKLEVLFRLAALNTGFMDSAPSYSYGAFVRTYWEWSGKGDYDPRGSDNVLSLTNSSTGVMCTKYNSSGGCATEEWFTAGDYPRRLFDASDPWDTGKNNGQSTYEQIKTAFQSAKLTADSTDWKNMNNNLITPGTETEAETVRKDTDYGWTISQKGKYFVVSIVDNSNFSKIKNNYNEFVRLRRIYEDDYLFDEECALRYGKACTYLERNDLKHVIEGEMDSLKHTIRNTTIDFEVRRVDDSSINKSDLELAGLDYPFTQEGDRIIFHVTPTDGLCNIRFKIGKVGSKEANMIWYCKRNDTTSNNYQDFITFFPGGIDYDAFNFNLICFPDDTREEEIVICPAIISAGEPYDDSDVHNCCEDNKPTIIRQAALDELFCARETGTVSVDNNLLRPNGEEYLDKEMTWCKQYCGTTIQYTPPVPTKAISDRTFEFSKNKFYSLSDDKIVGPELYQFKRCRTIIDFEGWYGAYYSTADNAATAYNSYQENKAYHDAWVYVKDHPTTGNINITCSTTVSATAEYIYTEAKNATMGVACPANSTIPDCTTTTTTTTTTASKKPNNKSKQIANVGESPQNKTYQSSYTSYSSTKSSSTKTGTGSKADTIEVKLYKLNDTDTFKYRKIKAVRESDNDIDFERASIESVNKKNYYDKTAFDTAVSNFKTTYSTTICNSAKDNAKGQFSSTTSSYPTTVYDLDNIEYGTCAELSCTWDDINTADPDDKISKASEATEATREYYNTVLSSLAGMEEALNICGGKGDDATPLTDRVKWENEPELDFSYNYLFVDDSGAVQNQNIRIDFEKLYEDEDGNKKCMVEYQTSLNRKPDTTMPAFQKWEDWAIKGFEQIYSDSKTFTKSTLTLHHLPSHSSSTLDNVDASITSGYYSASSKFSVDAVGLMECRWTDKYNKEYTVVPSGVIDLVDESNSTVTYTTEERMVRIQNLYGPDTIFTFNVTVKHKLSKTTASGRYETYFTLYNVADGDMDEMIHNEGSTCSGYDGVVNEHPVNLSCSIIVRNEASEYLDCTTPEYITPDTDPGECLKIKRAYIDYKEVDPVALFPTSNVTYGWNWNNTTEGRNTLAKIQDDANHGKTYSPENLTYSFTLTPSDLKAIREYNKTRISKGGYLDFNMQCDTTDVSVAVKCKSNFLTAISGGEPISLNNGKKLQLNTSNTNINVVRSRNW